MAISKSSKLAAAISKSGTTRVMQELKKARTAFITAGMVSDIPSTLSEYSKSYSGSKQYARSDYIFEMVREMESFYNKQGKKLERKKEALQKAGHLYTTPTTLQRKAGNSLIMFINTASKDIVTLGHATHPNYLKGTMSEKEKSKLVKSKYTPVKGESPVITSAGIRGAKLKTFGGSHIALAYNNFLIGLSSLGYTKTLTQVLKLSPSEWSRIYNLHPELDLVYKYAQFTGSGDDDIFCEWFGGEKADETGLEYEEWEQFE